MPLSEYEQRVLEQMEQQLRSDDPRLADAMHRSGPRRPLFMALGVLAVLAGLGLLVGGVATSYIWLGLLGFIAMFAGVLLMLHKPSTGGQQSGSERGQATPSPKGAGGKPAGPKQSKAPFMDRLEERWDRRRDEDR